VGRETSRLSTAKKRRGKEVKQGRSGLSIGEHRGSNVVPEEKKGRAVNWCGKENATGRQHVETGNGGDLDGKRRHAVIARKAGKKTQGIQWGGGVALSNGGEGGTVKRNSKKRAKREWSGVARWADI